MSRIQSFRGVRPTPSQAAEVASPPYDVMSTAEAKQMANARPHSFLRVIRAEIEFAEDVDPYSQEVYLRGGENLKKYQQEEVLIRDPKPCFYLYRQQMGEHIQTGIVATASCLEYDRDVIRKHEYTRPAKEEDRTRHIESLGAQTGPVWLTYRCVKAIDQFVQERTQREPLFQFTAPDGIVHTGWWVNHSNDVATLQQLFAERVPMLYIADGHHRSAAASIVAKKWREKGVEEGHPSQFFLSVLYPDNQLQILPYNRFVHDLNGHTKEALLEAIGKKFSCKPIDAPTPPSPPAVHQFDLYLDRQWYRLQTSETLYNPEDPISRLDVQILQQHLLTPILGIGDPRTDKRVEFIGGIRGHKGLEKRVDQEGGVAFACYATSIQQLFDVADANKVMPPKSTWFEPKLRSGLFVHLLEN